MTTIIEAKDSARDNLLKPDWSGSKRDAFRTIYCVNHNEVKHPEVEPGKRKYQMTAKIEGGRLIGNCSVCGRIDDLAMKLGLELPKGKVATDEPVEPVIAEPISTIPPGCPPDARSGDSSHSTESVEDSDTPEVEEAVIPPRKEPVEPVNVKGREPGSDDEPSAIPPVVPVKEPRFKFKPLSEIVKHHPGMRTWWLRDRIPAASVVLIHGAPATLKTTIAADIDCSIANAWAWRGINSKQGKILYVAAEDYYGARLRIEAWHERRGLSMDNDAIEMLDVPIVLAEEKDVDDLIEQINAMPVKPAIITIDTLALSMGKYSENNDMQLFCNGATRIKSQTGTTVIIIHHPGHGDKSRSRGGSQLPANADVIYQVERKDDVCTMKCQKMKNGIEPADLSWAIETQKTKWVDEDGKPITSVVLTPVDNPEPEDRPKQPSRQQEIALTVLRDLVRTQETNLSSCGIDPAGARVLMSEWKTAVVKVITAKSSRSDAIEALIDKGLVVADGLFVRLGS